MKTLYALLRLTVVFLGLLCSSQAAADTRPFAGFGIGLTSGHSLGGKHTIDLEAFGYSATLADSRLRGSSFGLSLDYLFALGDFRFGPRLKLEEGVQSGEDRIGNRYVSLDTSLKLEGMYSLNLLGGYVVTPRFMPYVSAGVTATYGTLGARLNVLHYSIGDSLEGWVGGFGGSVGFLYRVGTRGEIGVEYAKAVFSKRYEKCVKDLPICAALPLLIAPESINITYNWRF